MSCNCGSKNNKWAEMVAKRQIEANLKKKMQDSNKKDDGANSEKSNSR